MADIKFEDYSIKVKNAIADTAFGVVEECAGELESQVKRNTRVKTSKTKNSFSHRTSKTDSGIESVIGSSEENSIWEEFGTGDHALGGDGRKGGWYYVDDDGEGHFTHGKKPSRAFWRAYTALKDAIIKRIEEAFRGL